jgi:hypothetical protein
VLFKSNARVPHEVMAAQASRYAVTLWYFHGRAVQDVPIKPMLQTPGTKRLKLKYDEL